MIHFEMSTFFKYIFQVSFNEVFDVESLKTYVGFQSSVGGGPAYDEAIKEAGKLFADAKPRPGSRKILVIMVDKQTTSDPNVVKEKVKDLERTGIYYAFE